MNWLVLRKTAVAYNLSQRLSKVYKELAFKRLNHQAGGHLRNSNITVEIKGEKVLLVSLVETLKPVLGNNSIVIRPTLTEVSHVELDRALRKHEYGDNPRPFFTELNRELRKREDKLLGVLLK